MRNIPVLHNMDFKNNVLLIKLNSCHYKDTHVIPSNSILCYGL